METICIDNDAKMVAKAMKYDVGLYRKGDSGMIKLLVPRKIKN